MNHIVTVADIESAKMDTDEALVARYQKGDKNALNKLIARFQEPMNIQVKRRAYGVPVPMEAVKGQAINLLIQAAKSYTPTAGTTFRTFFESYQRGLNRYVHTLKNVVHLPENHSLKIGRFNEVSKDLRASLRREPTLVELSDRLSWPIPDVQRIAKKVGQGELAASGLDQLVGKAEETQQQVSRMNMIAEFLYAQLDSKEKAVFDLATGSHGKVKVKTDLEIGRRTGLSLGQVNRIRLKLANQIKKYS